MKVFLDICLCVIMAVLLFGILDQIVKVSQEALTVVSVASGITGKTETNMTYRHRLVIMVVETVLFVLLRWVVLLW